MHLVFFIQIDLEYAFLGTAIEYIEVAGAEIGWHRAYKSGADGHVPVHYPIDDVQHLMHLIFRHFQTGAIGLPDTKLELTCVHFRHQILTDEDKGESCQPEYQYEIQEHRETAT